MLFKIVISLISLYKYGYCYDSSDGIYNEEETRMIFELVAGATAIDKTSCIASSSQIPNDHRLVEEFEVTCDILTGTCAGYIVEVKSKKQLVVSFQPTLTLFQFVAEILSTGFPDVNFYNIGEVVFYFNVAFESLWSNVKKVLTKEEFKNYDVIFTGHSLGGSIASLTSLATVIEKVRNSSQVKVITFGEPRTGNRDFAKNFDKLIEYSFRIVHRGDVLARSPPCHKDMKDFQTMLCDEYSSKGPYHHKTEVWYPYGMKPGANYSVCHGGENAHCGNSFQIDFRNFAQGLTDHRKYFDKMVSQYGRFGCNKNREFDESEGFMGMMSTIIDFFNKHF